jgi:hypothetical protein
VKANATLEILVEGGKGVLEMARQAAETAVRAKDRAEAEFNISVSKIARELSDKLLASSSQYMVIRRTEKHRHDARWRAFWVSMAALAVFIGGYELAVSREGPEVEALKSTQAKVDDCWLHPVWVTTANRRTPACWASDLRPKPDIPTGGP